MIGIIDYGMGNLRSVENALDHIGVSSVISSDLNVLNTCDKLILPGVGAFNDCMANIKDRKLDIFIDDAVKKGTPLLGICLGMQMLFEESEENGLTKGFGFFKGRIIRMETDLPVPETGWNELEWNQEHPLKEKLPEHSYVYYVHSYYASGCSEDDLVCYSMYGDIKVPGLLIKDNVMASQFHPEKSADTGLSILSYFAKEFL